MKPRKNTAAYSRLHDRPVEDLIAAALALLDVSTRSGDGDPIAPGERQRVHAQVECAIAALRAPAAALAMAKDDGRRMAFDLIRRMERFGGGAVNKHLFHAYAHSRQPDRRTVVFRRRPQMDAVGDCLSALRGSEDALRGFTSVLTDFMVMVAGEGRTPISDEYSTPPRELPADEGAHA